MTEIVMPILADRFKKSSPSKRREILDGLEVRLAPLNRGAIGLMIDHNSLEGAFPTIRRVNAKAQQLFVAKAREYVEANHQPYPIKFSPPFAHNPAHPEKEEAEWGSMLREAINSHL